MLEPTTRLVFFGIICEAEACLFEGPDDKLLKLEVRHPAAITSGGFSFVNLDRLAGMFTSMSVAVAPASLYTYYMYKHITKFRRTEVRVKAAMIAVQRGQGLWDECCTWREVRHRMNGGSW